MAKNTKKQTKGGHAVEFLTWDKTGTPIWTMQCEQPSQEKAKEAMEKLHKERKDVSLRIRHTGKTTASVTTSADASKLRRAAPEAEGKPANKKATPAKKARGPKPDGKMSALDAAAKVLQETGEPMNTKELVAAMSSKRYWTSPGGKTPWATLYSAILRELTVKGKQARFKKTERGKFASNE